MTAHIYESPIRLDTQADCPGALCVVVMRCPEKDPAPRFPKADALERAMAQGECADRWTREDAAT